MSVVAIATFARLPDSLYSTDALVEKLARGARFTAANSGVPDDFGERPTLMPTLYGSQVCGRVGRSGRLQLTFPLAHCRSPGRVHVARRRDGARRRGEA